MGTVGYGKTIEKNIFKLSKGTDAIVKAPDIRIDLRKIVGESDPKELIFATNGNLMAGKKNTVGVAIDKDYIYYRNDFEEKGKIEIKSIASVNFSGKNRMGSFSLGDCIYVRTKTGITYELKSCLTGCNCEVMEKILQDIVNYKQEEYCDFFEYRQLSVDELPDELLSVYMKILYNYAYIGNDTISTKQYAIIQSIGQRIGLNKHVRKELRVYLLHMDERVKTGVLINTLKAYLSYASYEIVRFSIMQDLLYFLEVAREGVSWFEDSFLLNVKKSFDISNEQIQCMIAAVRIFRRMQDKDTFDLEKLEKENNVNMKHASSLGIPREAYFCSGSLYTTDKYHLFFKKEKKKQSINYQRELMLQSVIENVQKSLNIVVEDLNDITLQMMNCIKSGNRRDVKIEETTKRLNSLVKMYNQKVRETEELRLKIRVKEPIPANKMDQFPSKSILLEYYHLDNHSYYLNNDVSEDEYKFIDRLRGEYYEEE